MRHRNGAYVLSASDLAGFLGCRHRTALDMAVAHGELNRPHVEPDPLLEVLQQRGLEHEAQYVTSLRHDDGDVADVREGEPGDRLRKTREAMHRGARVIVQGMLEDGPWMGYPDLLLRVDTPSALGAWSYEVADTKLSRTTRAATILQLGLYSSMLETAQGLAPVHFHVVTPDPVKPQHTYRVNDYAAYVRLVRAHLLETVAQDWQTVASANYPEPVEQCQICRWQQRCAGTRRADDHLSLVAGISRVQRTELETRDVPTLTQLAHMPLPLAFKPARGSKASYERVREQARLQWASRDVDPPLHELLDVQKDQGLARLPEPSPGDLFLDLEGDPFVAEGGREYLFGLVDANGEYQARWAFSEREEREAFEWVMDVITNAMDADPAMHVYHYAPYEPAAFKRLMGRYVTHERELDAMLRSGRFVDLYGVVRQGVRAGIERYSIKNLEPLYAYVREVPLADANRCLPAMQLALMTNAVRELPSEVHDVVKGYNRDDCVSTLRLRDWLETQRARLVHDGVDVPRPVPDASEESAQVNAKAMVVAELRARLLDGVPEERGERDAAAQARWLMAYLLDYHRRENKATWWEFFRLRDLAEEEMLDERQAVAGLEFVERVRVVKKSVVDRYRYPEQEMEIEAGDDVMAKDGKKFGTVDAVDRHNRTIDILTGPSRAGQYPSAVFAFLFIPPDAMEDAMLRVGEAMASGRDDHPAARALLLGQPPVLRDAAFAQHADESTLNFAIRSGLSLQQSVLPIQGPPGAGKTYCGAKMICELVKQGKRVGITANSHKVIRNLMDTVAKDAASMGVDVRCGHKPPNGWEPEDIPPHITPLKNNADARAALDDGTVNVLGGTAWLWAHADLTSAVDVLFVDEAGQMALANVVAVSQAAESLVLLGDPQQLEQPRKGSHPDGVGVSALEHILHGAETIPADRGIFLRETWRLSPDICVFTSELFYESRLNARPTLERQRINGVSGLPASGLAIVSVNHDGNRNHSPEEADEVFELIEQLTRDGVTWTNADGVEQPLRGEDILVVAPYNAHVNRLAERLDGTGARVGTVDKFQGQEAPVVIYAMATSRPEDAPRGMEFLYSLNRLNVATSRARCLAIVVASPHLFEPECHTPRQIQLANALCRYRELASVVSQRQVPASSLRNARSPRAEKMTARVPR